MGYKALAASTEFNGQKSEASIGPTGIILMRLRISWRKVHQMVGIVRLVTIKSTRV